MIMCGDLRDPSIVSASFRVERDPNQTFMVIVYKQPFTEIDSFDRHIS